MAPSSSPPPPLLRTLCQGLLPRSLVHSGAEHKHDAGTKKKYKEKNQRGCLMIMFLSLPSSVGTSAKHQLSEPEPQLASAGMVQAGQRGTQWHHSGLLAAILPAHVVVW